MPVSREAWEVLGDLCQELIAAMSASSSAAGEGGTRRPGVVHPVRASHLNSCCTVQSFLCHMQPTLGVLGRRVRVVRGGLLSKAVCKMSRMTAEGAR